MSIVFLSAWKKKSKNNVLNQINLERCVVKFLEYSLVNIHESVQTLINNDIKKKQKFKNKNLSVKFKSLFTLRILNNKHELITLN